MKAALLYATSSREVAARCDGSYQQVYISGWGWLFVRAELTTINPETGLPDRIHPRPGEKYVGCTALHAETVAA